MCVQIKNLIGDKMKKNKNLVTEEDFCYTSLSQEKMDLFNKQNIEPAKEAVEAVIKSKKRINKIILTIGLVLGTIFTIKGVSAIYLKDCPPPQDKTAEPMEVCPDPEPEEELELL